MQCKAKRNNGAPCQAFGVDPETGYCWHHDPAREAERQKAISKGGRTTAERQRPYHSRTVDPDEARKPPTSAAEAQEWASWLVWATATGQVDKGTSRETSSALRTFLASLEKSEYEAAIEDLRAQVRLLKGEGPRLLDNGTN